MNHLLKTTFLALAVSLFMTISAHADPDQPTLDIYKTLMTASVTADYDGFVAVCDDKMKAALTKPMLEGVSHQLAPRTKGGYDSAYLGELNQRGFKVHLWRLIFKDGGDDMLATLSVKDGKCGGFYLH